MSSKLGEYILKIFDMSAMQIIPNSKRQFNFGNDQIF